MQLYPALDLGGGGLARAPHAGADPVTIAARWRAAGATWIHVVDLDRAMGTGHNSGLVRRLVAEVGSPLQLGGALAASPDIDQAVEWGLARVIVGVGALHLLDGLVRRHGADRIGLSLDVRSGVAVTLAGRPVGDPVDLLATARAAGLRTVVYRDLDRDGVFAGSALDAARDLLGGDVEIVLAGGTAALAELRAARNAGFAGMIVGRALLEERFSIEDALACCG